jgi:hypothetical protein
MIGSKGPRAAPACSRPAEQTLDQLLAEPIVQQLMRRDRVGEATIRHLLQATASARWASKAEDDLDADDPQSIVRLLCETARLWCSRYDREVRFQLPGMTGARLPMCRTP